MRKIIFILPILLLGITATAQYKWTPATITLNNGETYEGEARMNKKGYGFNITLPTVTFKSKKYKLRETYNTKEVESIVFTNTYTSKVDGKTTKEKSTDKFVPIETTGYGGSIFLQEIVDGKLSIYGTPFNNYKKKIDRSEAPYNKGKFSIIYLKKENADASLITVLGLEGFIQEHKAARYLSNCPITLDFIKEKDGDVNPVELVEFYNQSCD